MLNKQFIISIILCCISLSVVADNNIATLRGNNLDVETSAPRMAKVLNEDVRRKRNYPMQPPTIPHKIDNYQTDLRSNKCLTCHSRKFTETSRAPMISVTHYMNREGNFLANVSPRRYFCKQCHVVQTDAKELVGNSFQDMDELIKNKRNK